MTRGQIKREAKRQRRREILETLGMAAVMFVGMVAVILLVSCIY